MAERERINGAWSQNMMKAGDDMDLQVAVAKLDAIETMETEEASHAFNEWVGVIAEKLQQHELTAAEMATVIDGIRESLDKHYSADA